MSFLPFIPMRCMRSVQSVAITNDGIVAIDASPAFYLFSSQGELLRHTAISGVDTYIHRYSHSCSLSLDGAYALVSARCRGRATLVLLSTMKVVFVVSHILEVDFSLFSPDSRYFVLANDFGHLCFYDLSSFELIGELRLADGICAVSFSETKVAIATKNKKIQLYNTSTKQIESQYTLNETIGELYLSRNANLICAHMNNGTSVVINVALDKTYIVDINKEQPSAMVVNSKAGTMLLGTKGNQIFIYASLTGAKLGEIVLDYWGITALSIAKGSVAVGFCDGTTLILDFTKISELAQSLLESKNYMQLCLLANESPLLFLNERVCTGIFNARNEILMHRATSEEEKSGFESIIGVVLSDEYSRQELLKQLYSSQEIVPFMQELESGNTEAACTAAYHSPLLRQLREFGELRNRCFSGVVEEVKRLESNTDKFCAYMESSPQTCAKCVHNIVPDTKTLLEAYKKLLLSASSKNYVIAMELIKEHPVLRQTKVYRRMINYGESLIDRVLVTMRQNEHHKAFDYASTLSALKPFATIGEDLKKQTRAFVDMEMAYKSSDAEKLFALSQSEPLLKTTNYFKQSVKKYDETIFAPAYALAKSGDVQNVKLLISPYAKIDHFFSRNQELIKKAFVYEICRYAKEEDEQSSLDAYYNCFGWDQIYESVCTMLNKRANRELLKEDTNTQCFERQTFLTGDRDMNKKEEER